MGRTGVPCTCSHPHTPPHSSCQELFPTTSEDTRQLPGISVAGNIPFHSWKNSLCCHSHRNCHLNPTPGTAGGDRAHSSSWGHLTHPQALINLCVSMQESIKAPDNSPQLGEPSHSCQPSGAQTDGKGWGNGELAAESGPLRVHNTSG